MIVPNRFYASCHTKNAIQKKANKTDSTEEIACPHKSIKKICKVIENESEHSKWESFVKITKIENMPAIYIVTPCSSSVSHNENESLQYSILTRSIDKSDDSDHMSVLLLPLDDSQNDRVNDALCGEGPYYQILSEALTGAVARESMATLRPKHG